MSAFTSLISQLSGPSAGNSTPTGTLPWVQSGVKSIFYPAISIDPDRWDKLFPYRLLVVQTNPTTGQLSIVNGPAQSPTVTTSGSNSNSIINFEPTSTQWVFQLPITPQQLSITDQFAISTSATLRGVLEEHSGVRFKSISAAGTMGVWPFRQNADSKTGSNNAGILGQLFAGTIEAASSLVSSVQSVINTATSGTAANKPKTVRPEDSGSDAGPKSVGLYMAQCLQQFLEQYAEAKLNPANASWRLVFDIPKQNQSFIVSPQVYTWTQSESKPLEVMYNLQFKAWRRVTLLSQAGSASLSTLPLSPNILSQVLNTVTNARSALASATNLIGAVTSDVEAPLNILRQTSLFVKDLVGVAASVADLPFRIQSDYASSIKQSISNVTNAISSTNTSPAVAAQVSSIQASQQVKEGLSDEAVSGGQLGANAAAATKTDPSNAIFASPAQNFDLLNTVNVTDLQLTAAQQKSVDAVLSSASNLTVDDIKQYRASMLTLATQLSNSFGAGNTYYSQVYNKQAPTSRIQPMTLDEFDLLQSIYEVIQSYDILTATTFVDDLSVQSSVDYVAGLAANSGIAFQKPNSMTLAPVPFGLTIEQIAARYLGDAQRWIEIATINELRDPYIDETGFKYPLLSNGYKRQVTVASTQNLFLGQIITIKSATQSPTSRAILAIKSLSDTSYLLTLDGDSNLDSYLLSDQAYLQAYLPGTVNSQQKIFIPNSTVLANDPVVKTPGITNSDPLTGLSKVDLLLTDDGDVAVNNYGDFRYSYGMTNIIQALRIKVGTQMGKVLLHPDFGVGIAPGTINSDINVQALYDSFSRMILADQRFSGISKLQIVLNGPTVTINIAVTIPGKTGIFPLSFKLAS